MQGSLSYTETVCPLDPGFLIAHTRALSAADISLVNIYAIVATELIEGYLGRFLLNRTLTWTTSNGVNQPSQLWVQTTAPWPQTAYSNSSIIELPRPASSITSVTVGIWGQSGVLLVEGTDYQTDYLTQPARIRWISNLYAQTLKDHIQVVFVSGYGATASAIPTPILHAIAVLTVNLMENRGDSAPDVMSNAVLNLIQNYRFFAFTG